jgi:hypothetical protein
MLVHPTTAWSVYYRNADGILRRHVYFTKYHAQQFARAMAALLHITEIKVEGSNPFHSDHIEPSSY